MPVEQRSWGPASPAWLWVVPLVVVCAASCAAHQGSGGRPGPFHDVQIELPYRDALLRHPTLMEGGAALVETAPGRYHLVAVGSTENRAGPGASARTRVDMLRIAQVKAHQEAVRFVEVQMSGSVTIWASESSSSIDGGQAQSEFRVEEQIVERAEGVVRRTVAIGTWYSADGQSFYYAVAVPVLPQATRSGER